MEAAPRRAQQEDVPALAVTLADAFADYPWTRWTVEPEGHIERLRALYGIYLDVSVRFGEVWTMPDASAAAVWVSSQATARRDAYVRDRGLAARIAALAVHAEAAIPDGPRLWFMRRDPS